MYRNPGVFVREPRFGVAREGAPIIFLTAFCTLIFAVLGWWPVALLMLAALLFSGHFFRDPERVTPHAPGLAVSPADGKIIRIQERPDPFSGKPLTCISVFMNVTNVHVNRAPVAGTVTDVSYHAGKFFNAAWDKASLDNERCACQITDENGKAWTMVQVAGLVARRIVFRAEVGDTLKRGERYGLIRFGSRVDLYLPQGYAPAVEIGDKVTAGQTILAKKNK